MATTETQITKQEKPIVPAVVEAPISPNAETDKRVSEVLNEKKKRKHPVEARLADLVKEKNEIKEKAAKDKAELEAKIAEQNEKNIAAELERRKAANEAADKRPIREDFGGDSNGTAEFTAKMAEWVLRQQEKIQPRIAPTVTEPPKEDPLLKAALKEEFDGFQQAAGEFGKRNLDYNDTLQKAFDKGLAIRVPAGRAIMRLRAPEVSYWLARPENEVEARKFMAMDDMGQIAEVGRIAERLRVNPADFVSRAGNPGTRLEGSAVTDVRAENMSVDEYLKKRRQDIKAGLRRR